tara:strand:- start:1409 stop:1561 length:153 start_codon:yes stop_codon:yes gene_type:complete
MLKASDQDKQDILNDLSFEIKEAINLSKNYSKFGSLGMFVISAKNLELWK